MTKDSKSQIIEEITARGDGMTVPEGYFDDFAARMARQLPFREELDVPVAERKAPRNTTWMRVRPYVYMAAMFAGAWCLIKMFTLMSPTAADVSIDNYPALSLALEDDQFVDEYVIDGVSTYDIMEDSYMNSLGIDPDEEAAEQDGLEARPEAVADDTDGQPTYILPTDGDYSTPPYTQHD